MAGQDHNAAAADSFAPGPVGTVLSLSAAVLSGIGTIWIAALMLLVVADVIGRNFLNAPITGVAEIAGRSVVAIVFLQAAHAFLIRRIQGRLPLARDALELFFALTGTVVFALIVWASWGKTMGSWTSGEYFGVQGVFTIPTFPFRAITIIGATLASLACLYRAAHIRNSPESPDA